MTEAPTVFYSWQSDSPGGLNRWFIRDALKAAIDQLLAEVQHLPQRNLAVELLQKLLNNKLKIRSKKYLVQSRSFAEMLEATIRRYQNFHASTEYPS